MPKISIIVPVYRVEAYLERCVDSILAQSFSDFELILVDDGSPDQCPAMCDAYAVQDARIQVIHQANQGQSAARNAGIDWTFAHSGSQYLMFVDSDDWIHPRMLEWMLETAQKTHAEVCTARFECVASEEEAKIPSAYAIEEIPTDVFFRTQEGNFSVAWGKLYRKDLFKEIRYPVGKIFEDKFTTYQILFQFDSIPVIPTPLYFYFQNPSGTMRSPWSPKNLDTFEAGKQRLQFFKKRGKKELIYCEAQFYADQLMSLPAAANQYFQPLFEEFRDKLIPEFHLENCDAEQEPRLYKLIQRIKEHPECVDFILATYRDTRKFLLEKLEESSKTLEEISQELRRTQKKHKKYRRLFNELLFAFIGLLCIFLGCAAYLYATK